MDTGWRRWAGMARSSIGSGGIFAVNCYSTSSDSEDVCLVFSVWHRYVVSTRHSMISSNGQRVTFFLPRPFPARSRVQIS